MRTLASVKVISEILPIEGKDKIGLAHPAKRNMTAT